jgi:hypothetical protein
MSAAFDRLVPCFQFTPRFAARFALQQLLQPPLSSSLSDLCEVQKSNRIRQLFLSSFLASFFHNEEKWSLNTK